MEYRSVGEIPIKETYTFNSEDSEDEISEGPGNRIVITVTNSINATVISKIGSRAKIIIAGLMPCHDQLPMEKWVPSVQTLKIQGIIFSYLNMWSSVSAFNNLNELHIHIDGQNIPMDYYLVQVKEGVEIFHKTVSILSIRAEWENYSTMEPECKAWIVSESLFSLKIMEKCTRLAAFHIELPRDDDNKIYLAVRDFLIRVNSESTTIEVQAHNKDVCAVIAKKN